MEPSSTNECFGNPHPLLIHHILDDVLSYVAYADLQRCRLVCKDWNERAMILTRKEEYLIDSRSEALGFIDAFSIARSPTSMEVPIRKLNVDLDFMAEQKTSRYVSPELFLDCLKVGRMFIEEMEVIIDPDYESRGSDEDFLDMELFMGFVEKVVRSPRIILPKLKRFNFIFNDDLLNDDQERPNHGHCQKVGGFIKFMLQSAPNLTTYISNLYRFPSTVSKYIVQNLSEGLEWLDISALELDKNALNTLLKKRLQLKKLSVHIDTTKTEVDVINSFLRSEADTLQCLEVTSGRGSSYEALKRSLEGIEMPHVSDLTFNWGWRGPSLSILRQFPAVETLHVQDEVFEDKREFLDKFTLPKLKHVRFGFPPSKQCAKFLAHFCVNLDSLRLVDVDNDNEDECYMVRVIPWLKNLKRLEILVAESEQMDEQGVAGLESRLTGLPEEFCKEWRPGKPIEVPEGIERQPNISWLSELQELSTNACQLGHVTCDWALLRMPKLKILRVKKISEEVKTRLQNQGILVRMSENPF